MTNTMATHTAARPVFDFTTNALHAEAVLTMSVEAADVMSLVHDVTRLTSFIEDELQERYPVYHRINTIMYDQGEGVQAVCTLALMQMLAGAPDLVQVAFDRAVASITQHVFAARTPADIRHQVFAEFDQLAAEDKAARTQRRAATLPRRVRKVVQK